MYLQVNFTIFQSQNAHLRPFYSPYEKGHRSIIFTKSNFSPFSRLINRLRRHTIPKVVSIDSSDVFTLDLYQRKDPQMTFHHFFETKRLTMTISKKLFLRSQNDPNFESSKINVFFIFLPPDFFDMSDGLLSFKNQWLKVICGSFVWYRPSVKTS